MQPPPPVIPVITPFQCGYTAALIPAKGEWQLASPHVRHCPRLASPPLHSQHGQKYLYVPLPTSIILSLWWGGRWKTAAGWERTVGSLSTASLISACLHAAQTLYRPATQSSQTIQKYKGKSIPDHQYWGCVCVSADGSWRAGGCWGRIVTVIVWERTPQVTGILLHKQGTALK
jgi:hypothetical protein